MRKIIKFTLILIAFILPLLSYADKPSRAETGRFVDNGDGTVTDRKLRIMWQKYDNGNNVTFEEAQKYCRDLRLGNHSDWRLPKPEERDTEAAVVLMMPMHARAALARFDLYWSSDPGVLLPFNYHPAHGAEVARAYPAYKGDCAYVRAIRPIN